MDPNFNSEMENVINLCLKNTVGDDRMTLMTKRSFMIVATPLLISLTLYMFLRENVSPQKRIYNNCLTKMSQGECLIMHNAPNLPPNVKQIFISGYGSMDADIYRNLRNQGPQMCQTILNSCSQSMDTDICKIGKSLYQK